MLRLHGARGHILSDPCCTIVRMAPMKRREFIRQSGVGLAAAGVGWLPAAVGSKRSAVSMDPWNQLQLCEAGEALDPEGTDSEADFPGRIRAMHRLSKRAVWSRPWQPEVWLSHGHYCEMVGFTLSWEGPAPATAEMRWYSRAMRATDVADCLGAELSEVERRRRNIIGAARGFPWFDRWARGAGA